jgi:hypothetical protein
MKFPFAIAASIFLCSVFQSTTSLSQEKITPPQINPKQLLSEATLLFEVPYDGQAQIPRWSESNTVCSDSRSEQRDFVMSPW